jgi:hypothetical protein
MTTGLGAWWKYLILALVVAAPVELMAYFAARVLKAQHILIDRPSTEGYENYLRDRDSILGWPSPVTFGTGEIDSRGSRIVPSFPDPSAASCIAIFGDSFTWGAEVSADQAYGNVLAKMLGCRVANYGVGAYGTDQAVLRFIEKVDDRAPIVILGHFSENIVRNVNQLRDLTSGSRFGFKPRFVARDDGRIERIPLPTLTAAQYAVVLDQTTTLLPYEYFVPGQPGGPVPMAFPYSLAVARALAHYRVQARIRGVPSYAQFYDPGHPSKALATTIGVIHAFISVAKQRGQQPVVIVIPDEKDLRILRAGESLPYMPLSTALETAGVQSPDVARAMLEKIGVRDVCALFVSCGGNSHFNAEGYATLAAVVHRWLVASQLVPVPSAPQASSSSINLSSARSR